MNNKKYKVWGEHINIKEFIIGLIFSVSLLLLSLFLMNLITEDKKIHLVVGLIVVLSTFMINLSFIKPKRNIEMKKEIKNDN